jgi:hypothetical protein
MTRVLRGLGFTGLLAAAVAVGACSDGLDPSAGELATGTWGGENAGVIVADSMAHVHVGCTYGNFPLPSSLDRLGRFGSSGDYMVRAHPVAVGPPVPARLEGIVVGDRMTFTVTVNDTIAKQTIVLGPATVTHGREPRLGPCPICAVAAARMPSETFPITTSVDVTAR